MKSSNNKNYTNYFDKNVLSIDYGKKNVGLAMFRASSDLFPYAYGTLRFQGNQKLIKSLLEIISLEDIEVVVLGIPKLLDGQVTKMSKEIMGFGKELEKTLNKKSIDFHTQDETLSSYEARDRMKNSPRYNFKVDMNKIDEVAACIILEDFMRP